MSAPGLIPDRARLALRNLLGNQPASRASGGYGRQFERFEAHAASRVPIPGGDPVRPRRGPSTCPGGVDSALNKARAWRGVLNLTSSICTGPYLQVS